VDGNHADATVQPAALRAPEVILGCGWDSSADIWNLGCLVFELLTGRWLFVPRQLGPWTPEAYHLAHMPGITGDEFPALFLQKTKYFEKYFRDDGTLRLQVEEPASLEDALRNYNVLDDADMPLCVSFLRSMLRLKPSDRASAAQLVQHKWLRDVMNEFSSNRPPPITRT